MRVDGYRRHLLNAGVGRDRPIRTARFNGLWLPDKSGYTVEWREAGGVQKIFRRAKACNRKELPVFEDLEPGSADTPRA
jgi:hypothetical protein